MTNKEKFLKLVTNETGNTAQKIKERREKRSQMRESASIAFKVLDKLKELKWSQKKLAEEMGVSPQYINKVLRGKENMTLSTQVKLQDLLDIPVLASYYEKKKELISAEITITINVVEKAIQPTPEIAFNHELTPPQEKTNYIAMPTTQVFYGTKIYA